MNDMNSPVRLAIAGCGLVTGTYHLPAALRSPLVRVEALVDTDANRAHGLARTYGCDTTISCRVEDVLSEVEGVLIATPNDTHASVAEAVLNSGIPVLIEKPLTTEYAAAVRLCELADRNRTFIATGYRTRHFPSVQLMKQLLEEGFFGRVRSFRYECGSPGGWTPASAYNLNRQRAGGGVLVVTGTHFLDRMLYWFGEPVIVDFQDDSHGGPEANCTATVRYENALGSFTGVIQLSKTFQMRNRFTMETDGYHCELDEAESEEILAVPHCSPELQMRLKPKPSRASNGKANYFQIQIEEFAECIRTGKPPLVDGVFGARSVKLLEQFYARRSPMPEPWMWYSECREGAYV